MRIYVAAPWPLRHLAETLAYLLEQQYHTITRKWWDEETNSQNRGDDAYLDRLGVENCDVLISVSGAGSQGGKHTEFGIALALNKCIFVFGDQEQIFHYSHTISHVTNIKELLDELANL